MSDGKRGGRAQGALTALVLATYGNACHLRLPGCTRIATTKDHLIPWSLGGRDNLENLRPACRTCNSKRGNRILSGYGARIVVVMGPPAAGKTTHVLEHASPNDIVIDLDAIARALMPIQLETTHVYPEHVRDAAIAARGAALDRATRRAHGCTVWLIHAIPHPNQVAEYKALRYNVITIDPGRDVVDARARTMRPAIMARQVERYYSIWPDSTIPQATKPTDEQPDQSRTLVLSGERTPEW